MNADGDIPHLLVASRDARRGRTLAAMLEDAGWRVRQAEDTGIVEAVLGAAGADAAVVDLAGPTSTMGPLTIDRQRREVRVRGRTVAATPIEFALLDRLCERPGHVHSRADLGRAVWGRDWNGDPHVVDVHLSNLRRKLQRHAPELRFLHTARGEGFRLSDDLLTD